MRKNKLTGEWIIYAENRKKRPYEFEKKMEKKDIKNNPCPFCKGNEDKTTKAIFQDRQKDWSIRVFPNRFPAVEQQSEKITTEGFYDAIAAVGRHEVVVDTPNHDETIEQFSLEHIENILTVLQKRFLDIKQTENVSQQTLLLCSFSHAIMSQRIQLLFLS